MNAPSIPHSRPWIAECDRSVVGAILATGMVARGDTVKEFEDSVGRRLAAGRTIFHPSGTDALISALRILGVRTGDEVIIPTYVCENVLYAVDSLGAAPVLCDVNERGVMTADTVQPHLTPRTAAIIAVHIFGHPCAIPELASFNVPVIEDACQAFGLTIEGRPAGAIGAIGVLSFHATKCLTTGEGGMAVINDPEIPREPGTNCLPGTQGRVPRLPPVSDLQAALGLSQLRRYADFMATRARMLALYRHTASAAAHDVLAPPGSDFVFRFVLRCSTAFEDIQSHYLSRGIQIRRGVDALLHRQLGMPDSQFPSASRLFNSVYSIPFYPGLSDEEIERVLAALHSAPHAN